MIGIRTNTKDTIMDFTTFRNLSVERIESFMRISATRRNREWREHKQPQPVRIAYTPFREVG